MAPSHVIRNPDDHGARVRLRNHRHPPSMHAAHEGLVRGLHRRLPGQDAHDQRVSRQRLRPRRCHHPRAPNARRLRAEAPRQEQGWTYISLPKRSLVRIQPRYEKLGIFCPSTNMALQRNCRKYHIIIFQSYFTIITSNIPRLIHPSHVRPPPPLYALCAIMLTTPCRITECSVALIVGCVPSMRVLWSKILKPGVKTSRETYSTAPTGNRTNRGASQYIVVGEGTDRKTPDANTLIVSTEVHTSTTTVADYQQQQQQAAYRQTYHPPDGGRFDEAVPPPFGVYTEAYALQTRHQGVWGR